MASKDKKSVVLEILEKAKIQGSITTADIDEIIGEVDFDPEQLEKLYEQLKKEGINVIEAIGDDLEEITEAELRKIEKSDLGVAETEPTVPDNIAIDDPVKVYLKEWLNKKKKIIN